jgi:hypothetical protein
MISNDRIQATLITKAKAALSITTLLATAEGIKESQWQGKDFVYPAIRIKLGTQDLTQGTNCSTSNIPAIFECYTEDASSKKADVLAGAVANAFHGTTWSDKITGVRIVSIRIAGLTSAVREDINTWKAEANFQLIVEPIPTP